VIFEMPRPAPNYEEKIKKLEERKKFLQEKQDKLTIEMNDINRKIRGYGRRLDKKSIEETIMTTKKLGLNISDLKKLVSEGNIEEIKKMIEG
jgi:SMC interacting uncharacterized protein involved in chromosome segregation